MSENIKSELNDGVLVLTISRPEKKNAITTAMYDGLSAGLAWAESDPSVKAVVLQADGDSFTAGNDLADFRSKPITDGAEEGGAMHFLRKLAEATKPLIAAVQGNAVGVGTTLLLHCDLVYLADDARLITPFVNLALVPEAASSLLLPARIGHPRAFEMFALGEPVKAAEAVAMGLANAVVPNAELRDRARAAAVALTKRAPGSVAATKHLMRDRTAIAERMREEGRLFKERLATAEAQEAFAAFAERRQPDFSKF